jgi:hypothetical protein
MKKWRFAANFSPDTDIMIFKILSPKIWRKNWRFLLQTKLNYAIVIITSTPCSCRGQVQLRLQQVVGAPAERREELLKELEHFAFRGIPNVSSPRSPFFHAVPFRPYF